MEPPSKRPRLSIPEPEATDDDDGNGNNNEPDTLDIQTARAQNDLRLKSIFESIFEKYERDFTEVGDEIDLQTGDIVVDNGHLLGMEGEDDTGTGAGAGTGEKRGEGGGEWPYKSVDWSTPVVHEEPGSETGGDDDDDAWASSASTVAPGNVDNAGEWRRGVENSDVDIDSEDDDDRSSVDSLLDAALSIKDTKNDLPGRVTAKLDPTTFEKAIPALETHPEDIGQEPAESVWRVPEIHSKFSTPTASSRTCPARSFSNGIRSASPPGAGSLWALPQPGRPRKNNTDVAKQNKGKKDVAVKVTVGANKIAPSTEKPKRFSSPIANNWSFADVPDGSESDDPLQEDYQPSPTPKTALHIRGKRTGPVTPSRTQNRCSGCKRSFVTSGDYIEHLRSVLVSDLPDGRHDGTVVKRQLDAVDPKATDSKSQFLPNSSATVHGSPSSNGDQISTPTGKRGRRPMTPDEVKLIVTMRHLHQKKWSELLVHFPEKKKEQLVQWNHSHWNGRRACPPQLSSPWSREERDKLSAIKDQRGLTWSGIRAELPERSHAEIEFELLRLWVGEEVWNKDWAAEQESGSDLLLPVQG